MNNQTDREILRNLEWNIGRFENVDHLLAGFNNHQGSAFTANYGGVRTTIRFLDKHTDMSYVLDSKTSANSKMCEAAHGSGLACVERDIFLDHENTIDAVRRQLHAAAERAVSEGSAIAIGHHYSDTTLKVLAQELPKIEAQYGIELVHVSDVVEHRSGVNYTPSTL